MQNNIMQNPEQLTAQAKRALKSVFLVLFLDLVGFSIIFPLFPGILKYYLSLESNTGIVSIFLGFISKLELWLNGSAGQLNRFPIVIFGGILGALYSLLQFFFAPFWGRLSDKIGRRPVLLISVAGMVLSYLGWIFAGTFWLLILSRVLGGIMSGNISTASAVVSDVTTKANRSRGMAIIGIAFGMGFILGPVIGGLLSKVNLLELYPGLAAWGINPFSAPALFACVLSLVNWLLIFKTLQESYAPHQQKEKTVYRSINPFCFLQTKEHPGVFWTILTYFLFISVFSGMEFTLNFLLDERFAFDPMKIGLMFGFVGVVMALVQGGYVRRKAHKIGEKRMSIQGIFIIALGLALVGLSHHLSLLYLGLFFLGVGAAMTTPCLTALASLFAPSEDQGWVLGVFRSMGAFARVLGPLIACVVYWRFGSVAAYLIGAAFLVIPIFIGLQIPKVKVKLS